MNIVLFSVGWLISVGITSFTVIPILIIFRFGIPYTKQIEKLGFLTKNNHILRNYLVSVIILSLIYCGAYLLTGRLSNVLQSGYIFGTLWPLLFGFGQTSANDKNKQDYLEVNKDKMIKLPDH